jgi:hypothetical protein
MGPGFHNAWGNRCFIAEYPFSFQAIQFPDGNTTRAQRVAEAGRQGTCVMDSNSRGILLGVVLGVLFVIGAVVIGVNWGTDTIKTAGLPIEAPILFQPK